MDKTLMAIQTKFTIATFIGDEKMFREAVEAYRKWRSEPPRVSWRVFYL
ncbi:host cell division inhibitory peptide Kil [Escherichia coli]